MKLRKHVRTRRLAKVDQIGTDRIVDLQFGENEFAVKILKIQVEGLHAV